MGSSIPRKRLDVLFEVFAALRSRHPELRLVQQGGALTPAQREQVARLGIGDALLQPPQAGPGRRWRGSTAGRQAVLVPSEAEGFGLPVIEALACGAPVVASELPVLREVGDTACLYCAVGDVAGVGGRRWMRSCPAGTCLPLASCGSSVPGASPGRHTRARCSRPTSGGSRAEPPAGLVRWAPRVHGLLARSLPFAVRRSMRAPGCASSPPWAWLATTSTARPVSQRPGFLGNLLRAGFTTVSLFFVLSGFILAYNYLDEQGRFIGTARDFYRARFARIYPIYLLALALDIPLFVRLLSQAEPAAPPTEVARICASTLTLTQSWLEGGRPVWNTMAWTLSAEAFFYALFPFLGVWLARQSSRRLLVVAVSAWVLGVAPFLAGALASSLGAQDTGSLTVRLLRRVEPACQPALPAARLPEFVLGICLGLLFCRRTRQGSQACAHRGADRHVATIAAVLILLPPTPSASGPDGRARAPVRPLHLAARVRRRRNGLRLGDTTAACCSAAPATRSTCRTAR